MVYCASTGLVMYSSAEEAEKAVGKEEGCADSGGGGREGCA